MQAAVCTSENRLFKMENIEDDLCPAIHQDDVSADHNAFAIRRWRRQLPLQVHGNHGDVRFEFAWKHGANHELSLQAGRQAIPLGKSRRKMPVMGGVPAAEFVAIVIAEAVTPAVIVIIVVLMFISPVPVVMISTVILPISEGGASRE
jgi:hypothetical protein